MLQSAGGVQKGVGLALQGLFSEMAKGRGPPHGDTADPMRLRQALEAHTQMRGENQVLPFQLCEYTISIHL